MQTSTKRLELLAYGARGDRGDRSAAKTAAEMAAAVNAGRAHNRLVGYAGQPRDTLEPRHVKGTLTLMLTAGAHPVAAELHLLYADGEPRYTILADALLPRTEATCTPSDSLPPRSAPAPLRRPLLDLQQTPLSRPLKSFRNEPEAFDDAIRASEASVDILFRMDDAVQRFEGQLTRLSSLLTSASSCCAFAVGEERTLAAQLDRMHIATQTALAEFGESVHESCFNDLMFAEGDEAAEADIAMTTAHLLGSRTLELLEARNGLQEQARRKQSAIQRLGETRNDLRERVADLNAESSACAAELETAMELAYAQKHVLEEMSSPRQGAASGHVEAALRALSMALRALR